MRGKQAPKRKIAADHVYGNVEVAKFINYVMQDGKKEIARKIVYKAIEDSSAKLKVSGADGLIKAIENIKPKIEVRSRRVGGANFQVPVPVPESRQFALACRWMIDAARAARGSKEFWESLSREIVSAYHNEGNAIKKKEEVKRMAEANKAFAQFA